MELSRRAQREQEESEEREEKDYFEAHREDEMRRITDVDLEAVPIPTSRFQPPMFPSCLHR